MENSEEQIRFLLSKYTTLDINLPSNREKIIDGLIGSIVLFEDSRTIITFNYRDEPVEAVLDDIIAAANNGSNIDCLASPNVTNPNTLSQIRCSDLFFV